MLESNFTWHYDYCIEFLESKSLIPLACAVYRFLEGMHDFSAISWAIQRHRQVSHSIFTTTLAESEMALNIDVIYGSRWAFSITRCNIYLSGETMRKEFLKFLKTGYSILMRNQKKAKLHYHYNNSQASIC